MGYGYMLTAPDVKEMIQGHGADIVGIASVDRFDEAPEGYHPRDALHSCKSVVVFTKKLLNSKIASPSTVNPFPYTKWNVIARK